MMKISKIYILVIVFSFVAFILFLGSLSNKRLINYREKNNYLEADFKDFQEFRDILDDSEIILYFPRGKNTPGKIVRNMCDDFVLESITDSVRNLGSSSRLIVYNHKGGHVMSAGEMQVYPVIDKHIIVDIKDEEISNLTRPHISIIDGYKK